MLARVELSGPRAQLPAAGTRLPIEWARQFVGGIVEAAGFLYLGGTKWILLDGGCYFTAQGDGRGTGFQDPLHAKALRSFRPPTTEHTKYALRELEPAFVDAVARSEPSAVRATAEVGWHRRASDLEDDAMRLALRVRVFETQWPTGPGREFVSWEEPVRRFLKDRWAQAQIRDSLLSAIFSIETPSHPNSLQHASETAVVQAAFDDAYTSNPDGSYKADIRAIFGRALELADVFVPGSIPRRRWRQLAQAGRTGRLAQAWWRELRSAFDVLLNRAVRQRNAIIHGQDLVSDVIASVEPFFAQLSGYLAYLAIDAVAHGRDMDQELEERREALDEKFEKLPDESSGISLPEP